jgi:hypothetical protein
LARPPPPGQCRRLLAGELAVFDEFVDEVAEFEVGEFGRHLEHLLPGRQVAADLQPP